jgi:DNA-binding transcriptional LysR family regulator
MKIKLTIPFTDFMQMAIPITEHRLMRIEHNASTWWFMENNKLLKQKVNSKLHINRLQALRQAAIESRGIICATKLILREALNKGLLIEQLSQFIVPPMDVYLVYPERRYLPAKVRCFIETILKHYP